MDKLTIESQLEIQILDLQDEAGQYLLNNDYGKVIDLMKKAWLLIPEPKLNYGESFWVSRLFCEGYLCMEDFDNMRYWLEIYKSAALFRIDSGERIFMEARLEYSMRNFELAKVLFKKADQMSNGRLFKKKEYAEYFKFYKQK